MLTAILILIFCLLCSYGRYRIPNLQPKVVFDAEVVYPMVQLQLAYRQCFELLCANKPLRLKGGPGLYVSLSDYQKLRPESPGNLYQKNCSIKAKLLAQPLLFGGYAIAQVIEVQRLSQKPLLSK